MALRLEEPKTAQTEKKAGLDTEALQRFLEGTYHNQRATVRQWLKEPTFRRHYEQSKELSRDQVWDWCQELAARGVTRLPYPPEFGGAGQLGEFLATFQTLAYFDGSLLIKLGVQMGLFTGSIYNLGTERHHRKYLEKAMALELPGCFAMTERGHGSNVRDLETIAVFDKEADEFVIHTPHDGAHKEWIGNAACHAQMATVFAQLQVEGQSHGVHALLVPIRDDQGQVLPGVRIEDCGQKLGLNGVDNGKIWFDQVRVPRENLLDRFAKVDRQGRYSSPIQNPSKRFFTMIGTLVMGRISLASASVSAAKSGVTIAVEYAAKRRQFGANGEEEMVILDYQAHQRRLMPALASCYALNFATQHLTDLFLQDPQGGRELEALAAGLKATASWETMEMLQTCRECCGGQGYLAENRFSDLKADLDIFTTFEGDNTVLMQLVAKSLLTSYADQFSENLFLGVLRHFADQASHVFTELNPIVPRITNKEHLRDFDFLRSAFRFRKEALLVSAARRMKSRIDGGKDPFHAFNECQDHMIALARAYCEWVIAEQFAKAVERCAEPRLRASLERLCQLYCLVKIERDRGWFLEHGFLEPAKSKAIRAQVLELCQEVREESVDLVRAFGIPPEVLAAPIAQ